MKGIVNLGQTDYTVQVFIKDPASTTGQGKTGLAHNAMSASFVRTLTNNQVVRTAITMAALASLTAAHADGGWKEVDATNCPGIYRFDIPDGAFANGAWSVTVFLMIATGTASVKPMEFMLQIRPGATGGAPTVGTGTNNFRSDSSGRVPANVLAVVDVTLEGDGSDEAPWEAV